jgi:excisionase family DNA binding protein
MNESKQGELSSKIWNANEIAGYIGVSVRLVWAEIGKGTLRAHKVGHRVIVFEDDLRTWLLARPYGPETKMSRPRSRRLTRAAAAA